MKNILILIIALAGCKFLNQETQKKIFLKIKESNSIFLGDIEISNVSELEKAIAALIFIEEDNETSWVINFSIEDNTPMGKVAEVKDVLKKFREKSVIEYSSEKGNVLVRLPPYSKEKPDYTKLNKRNLLVVKVFNDSILVNGKNKSLEELTLISKVFLTNKNDDPNLPERVEKLLPKIGRVKCSSKSIIALQYDFSAKYSKYSEVYNLLRQVYSEIWNEYSQIYFDKKHEALSESDSNIISEILPFVLSET